jgi:hypothetical protein
MFVANEIISQVNTQTMRTLNQLLTKALLGKFSLKKFSLTGFEPGSSVPEANAMSTAPRRQDSQPFVCESKKMNDKLTLLIWKHSLFCGKTYS